MRLWGRLLTEEDRLDLARWQWEFSQALARAKAERGEAQVALDLEYEYARRAQLLRTQYWWAARSLCIAGAQAVLIYLLMAGRVTFWPSFVAYIIVSSLDVLSRRIEREARAHVFTHWPKVDWVPETRSQKAERESLMSQRTTQ